MVALRSTKKLNNPTVFRLALDVDDSSESEDRLVIDEGRSHAANAGGRHACKVCSQVAR
jgi:hypothetical protein